MEKQQVSMGRVARIRGMIEQGIEDPDLISPNFVSRAPWDVAVQQFTGNEDAKFDTDRVFSDFRMIVEEAFEDGDRVIVRWRMRGKWTGPLPFAPGIEPSGRDVEFTGSYNYRFIGDKIVEKDGEFDVKAASRALLGGMNITCGSDNCVDVVQVLSGSGSHPDRDKRPA